MLSMIADVQKKRLLDGHRRHILQILISDAQGNHPNFFPRDTEEMLEIINSALVVGNDPSGTRAKTAHDHVIVWPNSFLEELGIPQMNQIMNRDHEGCGCEQRRAHRKEVRQTRPAPQYLQRQANLLGKAKILPLRQESESPLG